MRLRNTMASFLKRLLYITSLQSLLFKASQNYTKCLSQIIEGHCNTVCGLECFEQVNEETCHVFECDQVKIKLAKSCKNYFVHAAFPSMIFFGKNNGNATQHLNIEQFSCFVTKHKMWWFRAAIKASISFFNIKLQSCKLKKH